MSLKKLLRSRKLNLHRKSSFVSLGLGRYGPYAVAGARKRGFHTWGSVGTMGTKVGLGYGNRANSVSLNHNITTGKSGLKLRHKKSKIEI